MIEDMQQELEIVNELGEEKKQHYLTLANGNLEEALTLACRGEVIIRRILGKVKSEAL